MSEFITALCERCGTRFPCTASFPAHMHKRGESVRCRPCREHYDAGVAALADDERERLALARPGVVVALRQLPNGRFDVRGPSVHTCECGEKFIGTPGRSLLDLQNHLFTVHGRVEPMLP